MRTGRRSSGGSVSGMADDKPTAAKPISLRLDAELRARVEEAVADGDRTAWIRDAIEQKLDPHAGMTSLTGEARAPDGRGGPVVPDGLRPVTSSSLRDRARSRRGL